MYKRQVSVPDFQHFLIYVLIFWNRLGKIIVLIKFCQATGTSLPDRRRYPEGGLALCAGLFVTFDALDKMVEKTFLGGIKNGSKSCN